MLEQSKSITQQNRRDGDLYFVNQAFVEALLKDIRATYHSDICFSGGYPGFFNGTFDTIGMKMNLKFSFSPLATFAGTR